MRRTALHFLEDIREATGNIRNYTEGMTYDEFLADRKTQDAVVRNFEIIGEAAKNLPDDLKARYSDVAWRQVAGLRDIMAHGYFRVDYETLWEIIYPDSWFPKRHPENYQSRKRAGEDRAEMIWKS